MIPPKVQQLARQHLVRMTDAKWQVYASHGDTVLNLFRQPGAKSLVRLGDGEMRILRDQDSIAPQLAEAVEHADCIGLPGMGIDPSQQRSKVPAQMRETIIHALQNHYQVELTNSIKIITELFSNMPELVGKLAAGKRVVWITSDADVIVKNLENPAFRDFYGLHDIVANDCVNAAARRGPVHVPGAYPANMSVSMAFEDIRRKLSGKDFDLALVGVGATGKLVCHYIKTTLGKPAVDIGVCMSYLKGARDRIQLRHNKVGVKYLGSNHLVWDPASINHSDAPD